MCAVYLNLLLIHINLHENAGVDMIRMLQQWDVGLCLRISQMNGRFTLNRIMRWFSWIGDGYAYGFVGLYLLLFHSDAARCVIPAGLVAFAIELAVQKLVKHFTKRDRPFIAVPGIQLLMKPPDQFSFPSGHTASAFLMAALLSALAPGSGRLLLYGYASVVGFSRIYNGLHYPSDVLAGMFLGLSSAKIGLILFM